MGETVIDWFEATYGRGGLTEETLPFQTWEDCRPYRRSLTLWDGTSGGLATLKQWLFLRQQYLQSVQQYTDEFMRLQVKFRIQDEASFLLSEVHMSVFSSMLSSRRWSLLITLHFSMLYSWSSLLRNLRRVHQSSQSSKSQNNSKTIKSSTFESPSQPNPSSHKTQQSTGSSPGTTKVVSLS
eukprot:TRINITY_DN7924_c1_g3_i2.p1 TRINITY_DN7924_c1_g3~~TRINITY_DN7924_c1_g3_i2.p1  ORF type:complete len:182 (-),score=22.34 TRINITY_DN7924_c1_g3_i2:1235-1780(-)